MLRLCAVVLTVLVFVQAAPAVREQRDLSRAELTRLYNTGVDVAERYIRPKEGMPSWIPNLYITTHSGVRVTLMDGRRFLIHKGPGYGQASDTVVTDAAHMSSQWQRRDSDTLHFGGAVTVGDMVRAGGDKYSLWRLQYCHTATNDMLNLG